MMWRIAEHTEAVELDGKWVVLDGQKYIVTELNEVGGWIWNRLKEGATLEMLVADLTEEYDVPAEQARMDIEAFIHAMLECGMVRHAG